MKVGTDSILLGCLTSIESGARILDVGTGTGVIALILAQRSERWANSITGLDIDPGCAALAASNFAKSTWSHRMDSVCLPIQQYGSAGQPYDLIVCNPPFFAGSLPSDAQRSRSRSVTSLSPTELASAANALLSEAGRLSFIVPAESSNPFRAACQSQGLFLQRVVTIHAQAGSEARREVLEFVRNSNAKRTVESMTIEYDHHNYTPEFHRLTSPFYLPRTFRHMKGNGDYFRPAGSDNDLIRN